MTVSAVTLDSSGNIGEVQQVAGGTTVIVTVGVTNSQFGTISPVSLPFNGGNDTLTTQFTAGTTVGSTTIAVTEPNGFSTPAANANVVPVTIQANSVIPGNVTVGFDLEETTSVSLQGTVTDITVVTITSNAPSQFLLSPDATSPGAATITVTIPAGFGKTPPFYVYGLASSGTATYTVTVPGFGSANGTVTLAKSGFVLSGPFGVGQDFSTTTLSPASANAIDVFSVQLDSTGNYAVLESVAGGLSISVNVGVNPTGIGSITTSPVTFTGGVNDVTTFFQPLANGTTAITAGTPAGFTTPATWGSVNATVTTPNITLGQNGSYTVGLNLEQQALIFLGAPVPSGGVTITLSSTSGLRLSATGADSGSTQIQLNLTAGTNSATYYIYGEGSSGTGTVSASGPG